MTKTGMIIAALIAMAYSAHAAQEDFRPPIQTAVRGDEDMNIAEITYDIISREMGDSAWSSFVKEVQNRFKEWSLEFDNNNIKQFLDDRLLAMAPSVTSGKGHSLRKFCQWLALYRVFSEPLPRYIREIPDNDKLWIKRELADFNWDRAALKIKEKAKH